MEMLRNSQPRKPAHRGRRRRRRRHCRQKKRNRPLATKRFAFAPISFPNNGSASEFPATPIPIGLKPGDNYWPSWEKVDGRTHFCASCLLHYSIDSQDTRDLRAVPRLILKTPATCVRSPPPNSLDTRNLCPVSAP